MNNVRQIHYIQLLIKTLFIKLIPLVALTWKPPLGFLKKFDLFAVDPGWSEIFFRGNNPLSPELDTIQTLTFPGRSS